MYKIGVIGDRDSVLGFIALGYSVHEADNAETAGRLLSSLVKSGEYAVIFLTEELAHDLEEQLAQYKDMPLPAVVSIPGQGGSTGYGMRNLRSAVERAVGADILFRE
jgi:V/A-type H+-transporting ATPase subunit F